MKYQSQDLLTINHEIILAMSAFCMVSNWFLFVYRFRSTVLMHLNLTQNSAHV